MGSTTEYSDFMGGIQYHYVGVSKNNGFTQMDGENKGKPYFLMDDLGVPLFSETSM